MGKVTILSAFADPVSGSPRTVRIYTPDAYELKRQARFPVLYMQDGQNVLAHPETPRVDTWRANVVLERLVKEGRLEPWIVVAIDHGPDRFGDYSPWDFPRIGAIGRADGYAQFLLEHLKPYIDRTYRTRPEARWTAVMGSSLGGLISLCLGFRFPNVFGRMAGLSPTVMWAEGALFQAWQQRHAQGSRIYLDAGANERMFIDGVFLDYAEATREFFIHLKRLGYSDHEVCLVLETGGRHHESDWARRLPFALRWLLG